MLRIALPFVLLYALFGCSDDTIDRVEITVDLPPESYALRSNTLTITNEDSVTLQYVNYTSPTLAYDGGMLFLKPDTVVNLPADSIITIALISFNKYFQEFHFRAGDTVAFSYKYKNIDEELIEFPVARVVNRQVDEYELNVDYYMHPHDVDPITYISKSLFRGEIDTAAQLQRLHVYYLTGRNNLTQLRRENKLSPDGYERQLNRLNALAEAIVYRLDSLNAVRPDFVLLDSLRIPRLTSVKKYDRRMVDQLMAKLPVPSVPGKFNTAKVDSIMTIVDSNPGNWPRPLVEDVLLQLLQIHYSKDPLRLNEEWEQYIRYFEDPKRQLKWIRLALDRDTHDLNIDTLRLAGLSAPALLAYDGTVTDMTTALENFPTEYILVDVWAIWCHACIRDAPVVESFIDSLSNTGLDLGMMKLSIDANEVDWRLHLIHRQVRSKKSVKNYIVAQPKENEFFSEHKINTLPRYMLVNRDGQVLISVIEGISQDPKFTFASIRETISEQ